MQTSAFLRVFAKAGVLQLADMAARLLILKLLTTRLSLDGYGLYSLVSAIAAFGTVLFGVEAYRFLQRHVATVTRPTSWISSQLMLETTIVAVVATLLAIVPSSQLPASLWWLSGTSLALVAIVTWSELMIVELVRYAVLQGRGIPGEGAKLARSLTQLTVLAAVPLLSLNSALVILVAGNLVAIMSLAVILVAGAEWRLPFSARRVDVRIMLGYAGFFVVPAIANQLLKVGDRFFVYGMLSGRDLAAYSIAYNVQLLCYGVAGGLASSLAYPLLVCDTSTEGPPAWWRWLRVQVAIQIVASAVLYLVAAPAITIVSSQSYAGALPVLRALTPLPVLMVLSGGLLMRFVAAGEVRRYAIVTVSAAIVAVALYATLIPRLGMSGAVIATLLGYAVSAALSVALILRSPTQPSALAGTRAS